MAYDKNKDYKKFVTVWVEAKKKGEQYEYVADKLRVSQDEVAGTAAYLRNRGINLPSLNDIVNIDTNEMNQYINDQLYGSKK